jgi:hypothetical protein
VRCDPRHARALTLPRRAPAGSARAQAAEAKARAAEEERLVAEAAMREAADEAARLEARRRKGDALPPEPEAGGEGVTRLAVRLPDGRRLDRRWSKDDALQSVVDWVEAVDADSYDVALVSHFPRREFGPADRALTLEQAGLHPQAMLFVKERDTDESEDGGGGETDQSDRDGDPVSSTGEGVRAGSS